MNDNTNDEKKNSTNIIDLIKSRLSNFMTIIIVIFVIVITFITFKYLGKSKSETNSNFSSSIASPLINTINSTVSSTSELVSNKISDLANSTSSNANANKTSILGIIFGILYFILFIIIIALLIQYFFKIDIIQPVKNIFIYKTSKKPEDQLDVIPEKNKNEEAELDTDPSILNENENENGNENENENENSKKDTNNVKSFSPKLQFKEVYHIPGNHYGYDDANSVCKALGGELADIKQMDDVYAKGGGWCSYGWSKNQMALFPTQYDHWNKLQTIKGHENDCGRPGINGGYIDNPNVMFGVNCYGYRPKMKPIESKLMESAEEYPITEQQIKFNKQVDYWKKKINDIIVAPFNAKKWSESDL